MTAPVGLHRTTWSLARSVEGLSRTPSRWRAQIRASRDSILELSLAFYPGWRAWLSGKEAPLEPEAQTGLIRLRVPAGEQQLEVRFTRTWWRVAADGLSLLSAIALGLLFYRGHAVPAAGSPARWSESGQPAAGGQGAK